jgi:hypothetical protein
MTEEKPHTPDDSSRKYWLDNPRNVDKIFWSVILLSVLLFFADALYHKHPEFSIEKTFGFYGVYAFCACLALIMAARFLRILVRRDESYYDDKTKGES